jgi:putative endonuclease
MFYVYLLKLNNGDIYKGYSSDLKQRIEQHCRGKVKSTKNFRPVKLIYYEAYLLEPDARARESYLKTSEGLKTIKRQLANLLNSEVK